MAVVISITLDLQGFHCLVSLHLSCTASILWRFVPPMSHVTLGPRVSSRMQTSGCDRSSKRGSWRCRSPHGSGQERWRPACGPCTPACTQSRVWMIEMRVLIMTAVSSPSKAPHLTILALPVTHGDLHKLCQLCSVLRLVDNVHHHTFLVPGLPGRDVPCGAPTHGLWHLAGPRLGPHHVRLHLHAVHAGEHPHQHWGVHNILQQPRHLVRTLLRWPVTEHNLRLLFYFW